MHAISQYRMIMGYADTSKRASASVAVAAAFTAAASISAAASATPSAAVSASSPPLLSHQAPPTTSRLLDRLHLCPTAAATAAAAAHYSKVQKGGKKLRNEKWPNDFDYFPAIRSQTINRFGKIFFHSTVLQFTR